MPQSAPAGLTRAQFLKRLGATAGVAAVGGAAYGAVRLAGGDSTGRTPARTGGSTSAQDPSQTPGPAAARSYRSRPDLHPPGMQVTGGDGLSGYLLLSPSIKAGSRVQAEPGGMIADSAGQPVWFRPVDPAIAVTNLKVSRYAAQPALTWWQGKVNGSGYGQGEGIILDTSYRRVATVRAGHRRQADLHELQLTPEGTALITCFPQSVEADLRSVGGPRRGQVLENVIQEVDIRSGRVLMEWRSLAHVPVADSYHPYHEPFDYLHANSIDVTPDGHLLISGRHTWALYKVHRRTGEIIWQLGGKRSDFSLDDSARFSWQHDARQLSPESITLFDDGSDGPVRTESQSRGLRLALDASGRRVRVDRSYDHPRPGLLAAAMGNVQTLPGGGVLVGWGIEPYATEFDRSGRVVADVQITKGFYSYRAHRYPWSGSPTEAPAIAVSSGGAHGPGRTGNRARVAHVSWNGATEVTHWQLHFGRRRGALRAGPIVARKGFETTIPLPRSGGVVRAVALDRTGRELGASPAVTV